MRVTYLSHSAFMVSTPDVILVFDYNRDPAHDVIKELKHRPETPVIFFVSNHHPDHYNDVIFELAQNHNRTYVLSNDVLARAKSSNIPIQGMSGGDQVLDLPGGVSVKAYKSIDVGVAFDVTLKDGRKVFHGGDLNSWFYDEKETPRVDAQLESKFTSIVNHIAEENPNGFDIAFMSVDTRRGKDFAKGAAQFLQTVKVKNFFPMHFDGDHAEACNFTLYPFTHPVDTKFHGLFKPGQTEDVN